MVSSLTPFNTKCEVETQRFYFPGVGYSVFFVRGGAVVEAFFYSFLANFATRTPSFIFLLTRSASRRKFPNRKDNIKRKPLGLG